MTPYLQNALVGFGSLFHFSAPPPPEISARRYLISSDPEEVIACVLANFQQGDFGVADALVPTMKGTDSFWVWSAWAQLLSAGAPSKLLQDFVGWAQAKQDEAALYKLCMAALSAGFTWAVEPTLRALPTFSDPALPSILETY